MRRIQYTYVRVPKQISNERCFVAVDRRSRLIRSFEERAIWKLGLLVVKNGRTAGVCCDADSEWSHRKLFSSFSVVRRDSKNLN